MDTQDIEVRIMIVTPMEHMKLNRVILMNFDLGRFLKAKVNWVPEYVQKISSLYDK